MMDKKGSIITYSLFRDVNNLIFKLFKHIKGNISNSKNVAGYVGWSAASASTQVSDWVVLNNFASFKYNNPIFFNNR